MLQTPRSIKKDGGERVKTQPVHRRDCSPSSPPFTLTTLTIHCPLTLRTIGEPVGLNSIREWADGYVAAAGRARGFLLPSLLILALFATRLEMSSWSGCSHPESRGDRRENEALEVLSRSTATLRRLLSFLAV